MAARLVCVECGSPIAHAYREYSRGNIRLVRCKQCRRDADPYVEVDAVILFLDLLLLSPAAWRHVIFNRLPRRTGSLHVLFQALVVVLLALTMGKMWLYAWESRNAGLRVPQEEAVGRLVDFLTRDCDEQGCGTDDASLSPSSSLERISRLLPPLRVVSDFSWFFACSLLETIAFGVGVVLVVSAFDLGRTAPPSLLSVGLTLVSLGKKETGESLARWVLWRRGSAMTKHDPAPPDSSWVSFLLDILHVTHPVKNDDDDDDTVPKRRRASSLSDAQDIPTPVAVAAAVIVALVISSVPRALILLAAIWEYDPSLAVVINILALVTNSLALHITLATPIAAAAVCVAGGSLAATSLRCLLWITDLLFSPMLLV